MAPSLTLDLRSVVATNANTAQVAQAKPHTRITHLVAPVERTPISNTCIEPVIIAQALHLFDHTWPLHLRFTQAERCATLPASFPLLHARHQDTHPLQPHDR